MSLNIIKKTSTHNTTYSKNRNIKFIVLHYTAGVTSKAGAAQNTASYFSTTKNQASADFIVDDVNIVQYNGDIENRYCWSVGGSKYKKLYTKESGKYFGICKNNNSISIEMCSRKINTKTLNAEDTDWYLTEATINNAVELTKYLMKTYNIDADHVIMHHHVTGKPCPNPWCINDGRLAEWNKFKNRLTNTNNSNVNITPKNESYIVQITASVLNVRAGAGTNYRITTTVKKNQKYTIVEEKNGWGRLKSGAGWISLSYIKKV